MKKIDSRVHWAVSMFDSESSGEYYEQQLEVMFLLSNRFLLQATRRQADMRR